MKTIQSRGMGSYVWRDTTNCPTNREYQFTLPSTVSVKIPHVLAMILHYQKVSALLMNCWKWYLSVALTWISFTESGGWTSFHVEECISCKLRAYILDPLFPVRLWAFSLVIYLSYSTYNKGVNLLPYAVLQDTGCNIALELLGLGQMVSGTKAS